MSKKHHISSIASGQDGLTIFRGNNERKYSRHSHFGLRHVVRIIQESPDDFYVHLLIDGWQAFYSPTGNDTKLEQLTAP